MLALAGHHIRAMLRNNGILIWVVAFPIILATLFMVMFDGMTSNQQLSTIAVGVVADENYQAPSAEPLRIMLAELAGQGSAAAEKSANAGGGSVDAANSAADGGALFSLISYEDADAAAAALLAREVEVVVSVDAAGKPQMAVPPNSLNSTHEALVQAVLDRYAQSEAAVAKLAESEPTALASPEAVAALAANLAGDEAQTTEVSVLRVNPSEMARFYYALLGFSTAMGANVAAVLTERLKANLSAVGARCQVSAMRPPRQLGAVLLASWALVFCCLMLAFCYIRFVAGVSFAGREALAPVACAACALVSCALGMALWALPWLSANVKDAVLTVGVLVLALPAGLYGEPALGLSDWLTQHMPWLQAVNPSVQAANAFYALTYYDSLVPFFQTLGTLLTIAAVLFVAAALCMRRQRYASL